MVNILKAIFLTKRNPCYRCGGDAKFQYMGFDYCFICRQLVVMMMPTIGFGGMFGFPGAQGYLERPDFGGKKKEA